MIAGDSFISCLPNTLVIQVGYEREYCG